MCMVKRILEMIGYKCTGNFVEQEEIKSFDWQEWLISHHGVRIKQRVPNFVRINECLSIAIESTATTVDITH